VDSPTQTTTTRQLGKVVVTGSIQMSKPGSILLSAEAQLVELRIGALFLG
jgi:hypothetical protein